MNYTETQHCVYAVRICQYSVCSLVMSFLYVRMREDDLESFPPRELTLPRYSGTIYIECTAHLLWEVVVQVRDDLHGDVGLASAWRPHHQSEPGMHARANGLHLSRSEGHRVP